MNGYPDRDGQPVRRKEDLLGNGTLTLAARIGSVVGAVIAFVGVPIVAFILWFAAEAWGDIKVVKKDLTDIGKYIAGAIADDRAHAGEHADIKRRLDIIENRVVYRGTP